MTNKETIEVSKEKLQSLYKTLTNYPKISKEQIVNEMQKCFGKKAFEPVDVRERIKTFEDACRELGEENKFVKQWRWIEKAGHDQTDIAAYLKLRIVTAALNEGWKPEFTDDEYRYYPWFVIYTKEELDAMTEEERCCVVGRASGVASAGGGLVCSSTNNVSTHSGACHGSRLAFKTEELAKYAGKQFIDIYADFMLSA